MLPAEVVVDGMQVHERDMMPERLVEGAGLSRVSPVAHPHLEIVTLKVGCGAATLALCSLQRLPNTRGTAFR